MPNELTSTKAKSKEDSTKLTKVLSTKLSIGDYDRFQKHTNDAYRAGAISKPSESEFLRYIVIHRSHKPTLLDLISDANNNC